MLELLKELCKMVGLLSDQVDKEKDPKIKRGFLELAVMVSEKIDTAAKYRELKTGNDLFHMVIGKIKETGNLINGYKKEAKTFSDLLDHVVNITNKLEGLSCGLELPSHPSSGNQTQ